MALTLEETYKKILDIIKKNCADIMGSSSLYSGYTLEVSNEQNFVRNRTYSPKALFLNVEFQEATLTFGQTVIPVSIDVLSEQNNINVAQALIFSLASNNNLQYSQDGTILQQYDSPFVFSTRFNEVGNGFRTLFKCRGRYLIAPDSIPVSSIVYSWTDPTASPTAQSEEWFPLSFGFDLSIQLDSQAFFQTANITESIAKIGTFSINFSMYQTDLAIFNNMIDIVNGVVSKETDSNFNGIDTTYHLTLNFKNGQQISKDFKLSRMTSGQRVADIPVLSLVFTI